jgi:hypothetical protein
MASLPKSWLFSDSFLKRAFAVWGHYFVANLIISVPFIILMLVFMGFFAAMMPEAGHMQPAVQ